jgi:nitroreductase
MKAFPPKERNGVYRAIASLRPSEGFRPDPVPEGVLARILRTASPTSSAAAWWRVLLVRDERLRRLAASALEEEFSGSGRPEGDDAHRRSAIADSPVHICVLCEPLPVERETAIGRLLQVSAAIHSLCLAARAEGVGIAVVAIGRGVELRRALAIPPDLRPFAYLGLGYPHAHDAPRVSPTGAARIVFEAVEVGPGKGFPERSCRLVPLEVGP